MTAVDDLSTLGKIQGQLTETDIGITGGQTGEGQGVCIFGKADAAIKMFLFLGQIAVGFFVIATALAAEDDFGLFGLAQCID